MQIAEAFGWTEWPFRIVVDESFANVWADRAAVKAEIEKRLRRIKVLPQSSLQLMWADLGAGKSHTLRHIEALFSASGGAASYTEIPVQQNDVLSAFRGFVAGIDEELLNALGNSLRTNVESPRGVVASDVNQALKLFASNDSTSRGIAREWFSAERNRPHLNNLRAYGIRNRIETEHQAQEAIVHLVNLLRDHTEAPVIWMLDEFQRAALSKGDKKSDKKLATWLVSLFNACPTGLHIMMACSVGQQSAVTAMLPPELLSRAATFPMLELPYLTRDEARVFATELFAHFSMNSHNHPEFPFEPAALRAIIDRVAEETNDRITPRVLMEALAAILYDTYETAQGEVVLPLSRTL